MSRKRFVGSEIDRISQTQTGRRPAFKVEIWNPNRTRVNQVVLNTARSPAYDVTDWVRQMTYQENITWENNDDAVATNVSIEVARDPNAQPIPIDETTFLDSAPIRIWQGDHSVPEEDWVPIFTGILRGNPAAIEYRRDGRRPDTFTVTAVDRAERYLNTVVTARSYKGPDDSGPGTDVGQAAVETAIERMQLDRREIAIGLQGYTIGHTSSQLVDIEVLKGIHQILFTVGKKPKFDGEGRLTAADTDLDKVPARRLEDMDLVVEIRREPSGRTLYNSVRLLGLDDELTEVVESTRRLAHGTITSGYFDRNVSLQVFFSEDKGKETTGRRAKDTKGRFDISSIGSLFGQGAKWVPNVEDDDVTTFSGTIQFDTGAQLEFRAALLATWLAAKAIVVAEMAIPSSLPLAAAAEGVATSSMLAMMLTLIELGFVEWEVHGKPFQHVYQQLASTAALDGLLTEDIKELEVRNDWLYDADYMEGRARELLRRELIKGWTYTITMIDDPLIEVDDVIDIEGSRYYVVSIRKQITRPGSETMELTAWRLS